MKNKKRTEFDTLGSIKINFNKFWGAQTQRSLENFRIGNEKMPVEIIKAIGLQKKAAEITLKQTGLEHLWTGENLNMIRNASLNERDYGDLVGLNKKETAEKFGEEQVHIWRRSYDTPPPNGESLKNVVERVGTYYKQNIEPLINKNKNVIIVAHGNSLRATMIKVGLYTPEEISKIELPTGSPFCIVFKNNKLESSFYLS